MTPTNRPTLLLLLLLTTTLFSQERQLLRDYLSSIQGRTNLSFSFKDNDLNSHTIQAREFESQEAYLDYLREQTLFDYLLLPDQTVAMRVRPDVTQWCVRIGNPELQGQWNNLMILTPYQRLVPESNGMLRFISPPDNQGITLTVKGYQPYKIQEQDFEQGCPELLLNGEVENLDAVYLTNYFAKGIRKNGDGSLSVDYKDFDILPGLIEPDVLLTLQALPGIQSVNETVSFLNIRGGTNDQNLILWDGIKMYQNGHFFGQISAFNPLLTKKVDVYKNATPARFGDGVSGLVAMYSADTATQEFTGELGMNLLSADGFFDVPLGKIGSLQVSGRRSINGLWKTPTYNSYFDKAFQNTELTSSGNPLPSSDDQFSFFDASFRLLVRPTDKDTFRANLLQVGNELTFLENAQVEGLFESRRSDLEQRNISGGFFYKRDWTDQFFTEALIYGTVYDIESTNVNVISNQRLLQRNSVEEAGIKIRGNYQLSEQLNTEIGYQFNETGITNFEEINNPFFRRTDKQVLITHGLYGSMRWNPFEGANIDAGLRVNHVGKFDELLIEPRLGFSYQFLKYFTVEVLGELKSQTTSQIIDFQNDFLGVENRRWVLSNPGAIPIIKGQQLSAGISMNRKGWLLSIEPYIRSVDGITTQSQGFQNQFENIRTNGSYQTYGVDFLLNKRFRKINTWFSYTYAKNDYTFEALSPSSFPNNIDVRHNLTYGITYSVKAFNFSGGLNWHTGKPTTLLETGNEVENGALNFAIPNAENIDDYFRIDLSATYELNLGDRSSLFFGASVWNLLDSRNVINHFFILGQDDTPEEIDEFALGITPNFSVRLKF